MTRGYTKKPCPGCGSTDTPYPSRSICPECRRKLVLADEVEKERAARSKNEARVYRISSRAHWQPYLPERGTGFGEYPIGVAFHALLEAAGEVAEHDYDAPVILEPEKRRENRSTYDVSRSYRPEVATAIGRLFDVVRTGLGLSYIEGVSRGRALLQQLAAGEIAPSDFEARDPRKGEGI